MLEGTNLKKRLQKEHNFTLTIFQSISSVIFILFIFFVALHMGISNRGIKILVHKYVDAVQLNETYFDNYIDAGFSEIQCSDLLSGQGMKDCVAKVMCEQVSALFSNSDAYTYDEDMCYEEVKGIISEYVFKNKIKLVSDDKIDTLTDYTMDISGISAMYIYGSPAAYRQSIYNRQSGKINDITNAFTFIAILSSPVFIITISLFLIICILIMSFVGNRENETIWKIINTFAYPALFIIGISLGYIFGASNNNILSKYVFSLFLISSLFGFATSGGTLFILHCCKRKYMDSDNWFDTWLNKIKDNHTSKQKYRKEA